MYRVKKNGARIGQAFCAKRKYILKFKLKKIKIQEVKPLQKIFIFISL